MALHDRSVKTKLFVLLLSGWQIWASQTKAATAIELNNTGSHAYANGRYAEAEQQFRRALLQLDGAPDSQVQSTIYINLGAVYRAEARYAESETFYLRALADREASFSKKSPKLIGPLNGLTLLYVNEGQLAKAETAGRRTMSIAAGEATLVPELRAEMRNNLAAALYGRGKYQEAEELATAALTEAQKCAGQVLQRQAALSLLGRINLARSRYAAADQYLTRAVEMGAAGGDRSGLAASWSNLAQVKEAQGDSRSAEELLKRSVVALEAMHGVEHPDVATVLSKLGTLYMKGKHSGRKAKEFYTEALRIDQKTIGPNSAKVAGDLSNLGALAVVRRRWTEAESDLDRALEIDKAALGAEDVDTGLVDGNLAILYCARGRFAEAEPLFRQAAATRERVYGPDDPALGKLLAHYEVALRSDQNFAEAEKVQVRVTRIQVRNALCEESRN